MADQNQNGVVEEGINGQAPFVPTGCDGGARVDNPVDNFMDGVPPTGNPQQPQQPAAGARGQHDAPDFIEVVRKAVVATAMSRDGVEYMKQFKATVDTYNQGNRQPTTVVPLSYPPETQAVVNGRNAFLLMFSECNQQGENLPTVAVERAALESMIAKLGSGIKMKNAIVITPEDYHKAPTMGSCLVNSFMSFTDQFVRTLTIDSLAANLIDISTNPDVFNRFNAKHCPHGVEPRSDLKITVSLNVPKHNFHNSNQTLFDLADTDKVEIGTIGAYVIFNQHNTNIYGQVTPVVVADDTNFSIPGQQPIFIPEVHISSITTILPIPELIPLMLSIAASVLLGNQYWKTQFSAVGNVEGAPNIGNLVINSQTGQPMDIMNLATRDKFINEMCTPPYLVLDIMEGRYRTPGLELYSLPEASAWQKIIDDLNRFFTTRRTQNGQAMVAAPFVNNNAMPPTQLLYNNYAGYVKALGSNYIDSRWCSFLNIVATFPQMDALARNLLVHYGREEERVKLLRNFYPDMVLHYVNHCVMISPDVLSRIQENVNRNLKVQTGNTATGYVDMSPLAAAARAFNTSASQQYFMATTNPFGQIYNTGSLF